MSVYLGTLSFSFFGTRHHKKNNNKKIQKIRITIQLRKPPTLQPPWIYLSGIQQ